MTAPRTVNNPEERTAIRVLAVCTIAPILCMAFQDLGSKYGDMDWLTKGYAAWPIMIAPVAMLVVLIRYRKLISNPKGANFSQLIKLVSCLFLIPNVAVIIGYSWLAVISILSTLTILVADRQLKKQAHT
ncbi:hypothetical protein OG864_20240 [Streptomyces sp. NBC_00124]|uniref:hypothetical protein n=1 Tax=Streptomyces sp. NBC_00124 TaxID=2975662 RepID=UPI002255EDB0|nr:hypothetical protein [Streptomyces sp. NBC_00124]MCX5361040.1 hypothetical protein [Streptomyces sp. NBC_00124]